MGEAKRKRALAQPTVYHHTSMLRTNLIWMSGKIEVEGKSAPVLHPQMGFLETDARFRREMKDFPPVAWFTTDISIPNCLIQSSLIFVNKNTRKSQQINLREDVAHGLSLNRLALGFPISDTPVIPWPQHYGYNTDEGDHLNETARDAEDDPENWWVSEEPIDVMLASEVWYSLSQFKPKLRRDDNYLKKVKEMVSLCQSTQGVYIPPAWLKIDQAQAFANSLNLPLMNPTAIAVSRHKP